MSQQGHRFAQCESDSRGTAIMEVWLQHLPNVPSCQSEAEWVDSTAVALHVSDEASPKGRRMREPKREPSCARDTFPSSPAAACRNGSAFQPDSYAAPHPISPLLFPFDSFAF